MVMLFVIIAAIVTVCMAIHVMLEVNALEKKVATMIDELRKYHEHG